MESLPALAKALNTSIAYLTGETMTLNVESIRNF
jgi:hypothetical protein